MDPRNDRTGTEHILYSLRSYIYKQTCQANCACAMHYARMYVHYSLDIHSSLSKAAAIAVMANSPSSHFV